MKIHGFVVERFALAVQADELAAGPESGVDPQNALSPQRRSQKKFPEVGGKNADGIGVGPVLGGQAHLGLHGAGDQPAVGVGDGLFDDLGIEPLAGDEPGEKQFEGLFFGRCDGKGQDVFAFAAPHGQNAVGGCFRKRFGPLEVVPVFGALGFLSRYHPAGQRSFFAIQPSQPGSCPGILADPFGDDVPGAGDGVFCGFDAIFRIHKALGAGLRIDPPLGEQLFGQRLEALFPGHRGPGPSLGAIRQVQVLQFGQGSGFGHPLLELVGEVPVFFKGSQNRLAPGVELPQPSESVANGSHGNLVQAPGGLLPITGNKGNGCPLVEQGDRCRNLPGSDG